MKRFINFIGAGKVGKTLARLIVNNQLAQIGAISNRTEKSTLNAIQFIGAGQYCAQIKNLPHANITFLTTPDELLLETCAALSTNQNLQPGDIVLHCSGALSSDILSAVKQKGCYLASVHPMSSFSNPALSVEKYKGTYCAIEGDDEAIKIIRPLFDAIGSITYLINKNKKIIYHAAGVFASNYVVTLSQQALNCLQEAGVEHQMSMHIITQLMQSTVSNLELTLSPQKALTGPIQRGDIQTLELHLNALTSQQQKKLYAILGQATIPLTSFDEEKKRRLAEVFDE